MAAGSFTVQPPRARPDDRARATAPALTSAWGRPTKATPSARASPSARSTPTSEPSARVE